MPQKYLSKNSSAPRPENSDSDEKDALFGLDTQITVMTEKTI
jgi:hypothetical protein